MIVRYLKWCTPSGLLNWYGNLKKQQAVQAQDRKAARLIEAYLAGHDEARLQLGCGPNLMTGWLNTDYDDREESVAFLDCTQPFPLPDNRFHYVFSEHLIEHLDYTDGSHMLREAYRVLRPGGRLRVTTPNFNFLIALCQPDKSELQERYIQWCAEKWPGVHQPEDVYVVNNFFRDWGHRFIYAPQVLCQVLEQIGFKDIQILRAGQSDDPNLKSLEKHGTIIGDDFNDLETFSVEAVK